MPNKKSRAMVTAADSSSDPKQPNRFEKKKNIRPNQPARPGRVPTLHLGVAVRLLNAILDGGPTDFADVAAKRLVESVA